MKKTLAERKLRSAANTNNSDLVEQLLSTSSPDVNSQDELKRSALHFAAAKVGIGQIYKLFLTPITRSQVTSRETDNDKLL